jgi:hypothetical protein
MIRTAVVSLIALLVVSPLLSAPAFPDPGTQPRAVFALHAVPHVWPPIPGAPCAVGRPTIPCRDYQVTWPILSSTDVYLVVARAYPEPGIAGISCGIRYNPAPQRGVDMFGWTLCADLEFTNAGSNGEWPASGGGNRITWSLVDACQRTVINPDGVHAIAGAFYLYAYSSDTFEVTPNWNLAGGWELAVVDCRLNTTYLDYCEYCTTGRIGFGPPDDYSNYDPYNPCAGTTPIAVQRTTWGGIKAKY